MTIEEAFGAVIKRLRRDKNLSQEQLALDSGLNRSFLSKVEGGKQQPSLVTVFSIAQALNIIPSKILQEVELFLKLYNPDMFKSESSRWSFDWISKIEEVINADSDCYKGTETILIADDEELVLNLLSSFLTDYGYNVIIAQDGNEAFIKYNNLATDIKLVILDIVMPNLNGHEVYKRIKEINSDAKVIITSGYKVNSSIVGNTNIVYKPFSPIEMLKTIRNTLDYAC